LLESQSKHVGTIEQIFAAALRLGKDLGTYIILWRPCCGFICEIEGSFNTRSKCIEICFSVSLQAVPAHHEQPTIAIEKGGEVAGRGVVEMEQISSCWVQSPQTGIRMRTLVLIEGGIQILLAIDGAVGGKEDHGVRAID